MKLSWLIGMAVVLGLGLVVVEFRTGQVHQVFRGNDPITAVQNDAAPSDVLGTAPSALPEASGIATSRIHPGVIWTHNDSGHRPRVYALDSTGVLRHTLHLQGVEAIDWEDIAGGPCPPLFAADSACLYVGDTGDNERRRDAYAVFVVPEPRALVDTSVDRTARFGKVAFSYRGASYNSEALAVDDIGSMLMITKGEEGATTAWQLAADQIRDGLESGIVLMPTMLGVLPLRPFPPLGRVVTGATFSKSGVLVVRTYTALYFFTRGEEAYEEVRPPCVPDVIDPIGEAVDAWGDRFFILLNESTRGHPGVLRRVECS